VGSEGSEDETSAAIREAWNAGDMRDAVAMTLRAHGAEVFGFLVAIHKDPDAADDAFSLFAERLWQSFASFEWRCSVRTWCYLLARNASTQVRRDAARRARGAVPLAGLAEVEEIAARIRTETLSVLRTEKRSAFQRMRDELPDEDRELLILRVDRQLAWRDVVRVLVPGGEAFDEPALAQQAARLRKRFQLVRERLRALGKERGLLE
jgi:RNA polymerase sigma-70 factor, ECF subfamily